MTGLPDPLPQDTWIAYQLSRKEGETQMRVLEQRVYHSLTQLAAAVAGGWIQTTPTLHKGTHFLSTVVYYGLDGAAVEPLRELAPIMAKVTYEDDVKDVKNRLIPIIKSWRKAKASAS